MKIIPVFEETKFNALYYIWNDDFKIIYTILFNNTHINFHVDQLNFDQIFTQVKSY